MKTFRAMGKNHEKEWRIWIDGSEVHTEHGVVGGTMQHTFDIAPPIGKKGTKSYISPEANAALLATRLIREKTERHGYVDVTEQNTTSGRFEDSFFSKPPKSLRFGKPQHQPKPNTKEWASFSSLIGSSAAIYTVKRDGFCHPIFIDRRGDIRIFTRRMDDHTAKYPALVESLKKAKLPRRTILITELLVLNGDNEDRLAVQSISNSKPQRAVMLQQNPNYLIQSLIIGMGFWDGIDLSNNTFGSTIELIVDHFGLKSESPPHFCALEVLYGSFEEAKKAVHDRRLEGLVVYDGNAVPGDALYNFAGQDYRTPCWKWKPAYEDDFVAVFDPPEYGSFGRGRHLTSMGSVALCQYDNLNNLIHISDCGSGFDDEQRCSVAAKKPFMMVAEVKFAQRRYVKDGDVSNSLVEPIFVRWRKDKDPFEVVNKKL